MFMTIYLLVTYTFFLQKMFVFDSPWVIVIASIFYAGVIFCYLLADNFRLKKETVYLFVIATVAIIIVVIGSVRELSLDRIIPLVLTLTFILFSLHLSKAQFTLRFFVILFTVLFSLELSVILIECFDSVFGFEVHKWHYFSWFHEVNSERAALIRPGIGVDYYEAWPTFVGVRGWPNETMPLLLGFAFPVAVYLLSSARSVDRLIGVLLCATAVALPIFANILTHTISTLLCVSAILSRHRILYFVAFVIALVPAVYYFDVYQSTVFTDAFSILDGKGGEPMLKLAVAFDLWGYFVLVTNADPLHFLVGLSKDLFQSSLYFFEIRLLNMILTNGVFYFIFLLIVISRSMFISPTSRDRLDRQSAFHFGLKCSLFIFLLDTLHSGVVFNATDFIFWMFMCALSISLGKNLVSEQKR